MTDKNPTGITPTSDGGFIATGPGIRVYQFKATQHALKLRANGIEVTSKFPTVKQLVKQWHIDPPVRTYMQLYEVFVTREALWRTYDYDIGWLTHGRASDG